MVNCTLVGTPNCIVAGEALNSVTSILSLISISAAVEVAVTTIPAAN